MTNWYPSVCDCKFVVNQNFELVSAVKGSEHGHSSLSDAAAFQAVKDLIAAQPVPVPESVRPYPLRKELHIRGLLTSVEAAVAASGVEVELAWKHAIEFRRQDPLIIAMAGALNISSETLDDIFRNAKQYE